MRLLQNVKVPLHILRSCGARRNAQHVLGKVCHAVEKRTSSGHHDIARESTEIILFQGIADVVEDLVRPVFEYLAQEVGVVVTAVQLYSSDRVYDAGQNGTVAHL